MSGGLDIIIVDDDPSVGSLLAVIIKKFYTWGDIIVFTDVDEAIQHCLNRDVDVAIFIVDVFLEDKTGFFFLDAIEKKFPTSHEDAIIITGNASDDVVNLCIASDVNYLLEKPIKPYALQLAIRAISGKYLEFARKLLKDPVFAENVAKL
jgi:response regulator of citrate/malate metabolism